MADPVFAALAGALLAPEQPVSAELAGMLRWLGLPWPRQPGAEEQHRARMLTAAAGFERVFQLEAPEAPGMAVFGAEVAPDALAASPGHGVFGVSGTGTTLLAALESCIGEGIELLSGVETPLDLALQRASPPPGGAADLPEAWQVPDAGWLPARRLTDGATRWLPAGLCLRRPRGQTGGGAPWPLSIGCAAGTSLPAAALHGLLELVERDAAALWWRGGRRGRPLPLEHPALAGAAALLRRLRRGKQGRQSWLLDITTDLAIPVVAAISVGSDGAGFCCGLAARPGLLAAAEGAVLELCQMELALGVVAAKRAEAGEAALNPRDHAHEQRFHHIRASECALLHPMGEPLARPEPAPAPPEQALARLVAGLGRQGANPLLLPLTRNIFGVPVCRVLCPELELEPTQAMGPRLRRTVAETGGGDCHTRGIALM